MRSVRRPAVAGIFYPGDPGVLAETVDAFVAAGSAWEIPPKAVVVPHAGYVYSGALAGLAFATLGRARASVRRVVLLGPCHRVPVRGLALPGCDMLATPLGQLAVDAAADGLDHVVTRPDVHAQEHSLEVQLPFLQRVLGDVAVVPLAVGSAAPEEVAAVLGALWGGPETLIVISTDLSHYHPYDEARRLDAATIDDVLELRPTIRHDRACGATPLNGLLAAAAGRLEPVLVGACNSGDTAGDRERVVGYASFAFREVAA